MPTVKLGDVTMEVRESYRTYQKLLHEMEGRITLQFLGWIIYRIFRIGGVVYA